MEKRQDLDSSDVASKITVGETRLVDVEVEYKVKVEIFYEVIPRENKGVGVRSERKAASIKRQIFRTSREAGRKS